QRQLQSTRQSIDGNNFRGAQVPRRGDHVQAESAGALHDQAVTLAEAAADQALDDLRQGAVDGRHDRVGQLVRDLDADVPGRQVVVLRKPGNEVRKDARLAEAPFETGTHLLRAGLGLVAQTGHASPTREEVVVDDA